MLSRRLRLVKIDADLILQTLLNPFGGWTPHLQIQGLPKGTTLVAMQTTFEVVQQLVLLVHSDDPVADPVSSWPAVSPRSSSSAPPAPARASPPSTSCMIAQKYPGIRTAIVRKFRSTITQSAMVTFEEKVCVPGDGVKFNTVDQQYNFPRSRDRPAVRHRRRRAGRPDQDPLHRVRHHLRAGVHGDR
jgi:hypothetical protein